MSERTWRFAQKIQTERAIITLVNSSAIFKSSLSGLTMGAVEEWRVSNLDAKCVARADVVAKLLCEISTRCELDADKSRDVFREEVLLPSESLSTLLATLKTALNKPT